MAKRKSIEERLGLELRKLRKASGYTQETLALEAGVEPNYVSLVELGRSSPTIGMLFKLCQPLGIQPSDLLQQMERDN